MYPQSNYTSTIKTAPGSKSLVKTKYITASGNQISSFTILVCTCADSSKSTTHQVIPDLELHQTTKEATAMTT
jgi:hypothetical protein